MTPDFFGPVARDDLAQALAWIASDNEVAARAMLQATLQSARRIVERPMLGRVGPELLPAPYRFWRVVGFPYLMVYNADRQPAPAKVRPSQPPRAAETLYAGRLNCGNCPFAPTSLRKGKF